ncbi:hypothetical protein BJV82DRAFT_708803 [Fennellomyces sp. T-0311]|nr:hypothetical protein BJV82DRAFT_708803 [Fennellomyces sp. T-0311]
MKSSYSPAQSGLFGYLLVAVMLSSTNLVAAQAPAGCTAATVFNQCLTDQDIYLKTCKDQEFSCLCKWNQAKLSCWDNCPSDPSRATQQGLVQNYCAIASANAPSSTSALPSSTSASISSSATLTHAPSSTTASHTSDAMARIVDLRQTQAILACVLLSAVYAVVF